MVNIRRVLLGENVRTFYAKTTSGCHPYQQFNDRYRRIFYDHRSGLYPGFRPYLWAKLLDDHQPAGFRRVPFVRDYAAPFLLNGSQPLYGETLGQSDNRDRHPPGEFLSVHEFEIPADS